MFQAVQCHSNLGENKTNVKLMEILIAVEVNYDSRTPFKTILGFLVILCLLKDFLRSS